MELSTDRLDTVGTPGVGGRTPPRRASSSTGVLYLLGLFATLAGLAYVLADQLLLHGLARHLHAVYDPYGKQAQPGPLYGYLYSVGALGVICWLISLRQIRIAARHARLWGTVFAVAALFVVLPPLVVGEYGRLVIPVQLGIWYAVGWLFGVVGLVLRRRPASKA